MYIYIYNIVYTALCLVGGEQYVSGRVRRVGAGLSVIHNPRLASPVHDPVPTAGRHAPTYHKKELLMLFLKMSIKITQV